MKDGNRSVSMVIHGKVQGVGFRQSARAKGKELGLALTAENLADGTVRIETSGAQEIVAQLISWAHHGPAMADVEKVDVTDTDTTRGFA